MASSVNIVTGARLHFGPLASGGATGGRFGGVGMMISSPGYALSASISDQDQCAGENHVSQRVMEFIHRIRQATQQELSIPPVAIDVRSSIPAHSGLGSGTQLALATAATMSRLAGETDVSATELARRAGRGLRSAIGLHGFAQGGMLIDGGRSRTAQLGTLVSRLPFPQDWRLILASPTDSAGLSGVAEQSAFASQQPMPHELTAELCRIALMEWLPALIETDFERASNAMFDYGHAVGQFFRPIQGGVFAHPLMAELADEVRSCHINGVAQTSWGPTIAILCENAIAADSSMNELKRDSRFSSCLIRVTEPLNEGARIEIV